MTKIYSVYDKVERKFSFPFSSNTDYGAVRRMKHSDIFKNVPMTDFDLYCIGVFDEDGSNDFVVNGSKIIKIDWNLDIKTEGDL